MDLYFFFAFIIGIAFGFLLEQAGFSTSRKLVGVFYGYDFTVLKVFFTAAFTAALGLYFFRFMGWIDMAYVYVPGLFTWAAIVGGAVMGAGFILGGFCPGTGFAAAVIGKIDAMVFVAGIFLGVFLFGIFFDIIQPLYEGYAQGTVFIYDVLGMSQGLFAALLIIAAMAAFSIAEKMERGSGRFAELRNHEALDLKFPATLLAVLVVMIFLLPEQRTSYRNEKSRDALTEKMLGGTHYVDAIKTAHSLMRGIDDIHLVDVRPLEDYNRFHLPGAVSVPMEYLLEPAYAPLLVSGNRRTVFYSNGDVLAGQAWFLAERAGMGNMYVLEGGLNRFFNLLFGPKTDEEAQALGADNLRFLEHARAYFRDGVSRRNVPRESRLPEFDATQFAPIEGGC